VTDGNVAMVMSIDGQRPALEELGMWPPIDPGVPR
jgi:hypothetical protein